MSNNNIFSFSLSFLSVHENDIKCKYLQYAIKLANKRNEKRLSAITELTTIMLEDKLPKIDTGQIKEEEGDGRDREREWNYKNNNHHTTNVSSTNHLILTLSQSHISLIETACLIGFK